VFCCVAIFEIPASGSIEARRRWAVVYTNKNRSSAVVPLT
jgi:hypothetical protein